MTADCDSRKGGRAREEGCFRWTCDSVFRWRQSFSQSKHIVSQAVRPPRSLDWCRAGLAFTRPRLLCQVAGFECEMVQIFYKPQNILERHAKVGYIQIATDESRCYAPAGTGGWSSVPRCLPERLSVCFSDSCLMRCCCSRFQLFMASRDLMSATVSPRPPRSVMPS